MIDLLLVAQLSYAYGHYLVGDALYTHRANAIEQVEMCSKLEPGLRSFIKRGADGEVLAQAQRLTSEGFQVLPDGRVQRERGDRPIAVGDTLPGACAGL